MKRASPLWPGFTLVELMIVIMIIGMLAGIAIPHISRAIRLANEGSTVAKLGSLRSALSIYYADNDDLFPSDLDPLLRPGNRYLPRSPSAYTGAHGERGGVQYSAARSSDTDTGSWGYATDPPDAGTVWVDCTHTDSKNKVWNQY